MGPRPLDRIAGAAKQLEIGDMVMTALRLWHNMIHLQMPRLKMRAAAVAVALLIAVEPGLILSAAVARHNVQIGALRYILAVRALIQHPQLVFHPRYNQLHRLRGDVDADPIAP